VDNALEYWITVLRDRTTSRHAYRMAARNISRILAYYTIQKLPAEPITIQTPIAETVGKKISKEIVLIPILRSGMAMLDPFLDMFPDARVGIVGLKRDEKTAIAHWYYRNIPPIDNAAIILILDPMIATGGTALELLAYLSAQGVVQRNIIFISIISAPDGLSAIRALYPDVAIICAAYDQALTQEKFIYPGLGDFGDRYFGTEK
jgi:uracil phosphoribosyltransferase